jgi:hypothetical protein
MELVEEYTEWSSEKEKSGEMSKYFAFQAQIWHFKNLDSWECWEVKSSELDELKQVEFNVSTMNWMEIIIRGYIGLCER